MSSALVQDCSRKKPKDEVVKLSARRTVVLVAYEYDGLSCDDVRRYFTPNALYMTGASSAAEN